MERFITILIGCYLGLLPFDNLKNLSGDTITKILGLLIIFLIVLYYIFKRKNKLIVNFFIIGVSFLFIYYLLSYLICTNVIGGEIVRFIYLFVLFVLITQFCQNNFQRKTIYKYSIILLTIVSVFAIILNINGVDRTYFYIFKNMAVDANIYCSSMIFPSLYLVYKLLNDENSVKRKITLIIPFFLILFSILLTGSRGGILAILFGIAIIILFSSTKNIKHKYKFIFLIILNILIFAMYMPQDIINRLNISSVIKDKATDRFVIWGKAINIFNNGNIINKILGYGFYSFKELIGLNLFSHNIIIQTLIEGGLVVLCYLFFLYNKIIKFFIKKKNILMISFLISILIMSCSIEVINSRFLWNSFILIAININMYYISNNGGDLNGIG